MNTKQLLSLFAALGVVVFFLGVGNNSVHAKSKSQINPKALKAVSCDELSTDEDDVETQAADLRELDEADLEEQINHLKTNLEEQGQDELAVLGEKVKNLEESWLSFESNKESLVARKELALKLMDLIKYLVSVAAVYSTVVTIVPPLAFNLEMIFIALEKISHSASISLVALCFLKFFSWSQGNRSENVDASPTPPQPLLLN